MIFQIFFLGWSWEQTSKYLIVEVLYLDLEDLKQSKSDGGAGWVGGGGGGNGETESRTPIIKSLLGASVPPEPNPMFGPQSQAESRGAIKNLILVGTIIMLVALVRHVFHYLSSSSVTTGT